MIPLHPEHGNLIVASGVAVLVFLADAVVGDAGSVESMTLKGALMLAIIYLVRQNTLQREKSDASAIEREKAMVDALNLNAKTNQETKSAVDTMTGYFRTVAQTILNRDIHPLLPKDPE